MKPAILATLAAAGIFGIMLFPQATLPAPQTALHISLTGSGREWATLRFATNYLFVALTSSDLELPLGQWQASYPILSNGSFWVTGTPPIFCTAYWQSKAQGGTQ